MSGERKLIVAVLELAIKDYISRNMTYRQQAAHWFLREEEDLFSFVWCCRHLDIDPKRTFNKIRKMTMASFKKINRNKEAEA